MTCTVCQYEWCWVCGISYNSFFHTSVVGLLICELIGLSFFQKRKLLSITFLLLLTIFFPLVAFIICCFTVGGGILYPYNSRKCCFKLDGCFRKMLRYRPCKFTISLTNIENTCLKSIYVMLFLFLLIYLPFFLLLVTLSIGFGSILFAILIVPSIFIYCFVSIRLLCCWKMRYSPREEL